VRVTCPHCGVRLQVRPDVAGKRGRCPNPSCGEVLQIPPATGNATSGNVSENDTAKVPQKKSASQKNVPVRPRSTGTQTRTAKAEPGIPGPSPIQPKTTRQCSVSGRSKPGRSVPVTVIVGSLLLVLVIGGTLVFRSSGHAPPLQAGTEVVASAPVEPKPVEADFQRDLAPFIKTYCNDCHGTEAQEGDFAFDRYNSLASIHRDRSIWVKVMKLVKLGAMPPADADQPSAEERQKVVDWLDHQLFYVDCNAPQDPGRVTVRRLNKTEYNNTVNDLLKIDFRPADDFPSDDVGHGFDNIGDVLTIPPLLMEKYLAAAEQISGKVIPPGNPLFDLRIADGDQLGSEGSVQDSSHGKYMLSRGKVFHTFPLPREGKYKLHFLARQDKAGPEDAKMEVKVDDKVLKTVSVKQTRGFEKISFDVTSDGKPMQVSTEFLNDFYKADAKDGKDRNIEINSIELEGPLDTRESDRDGLLLTRHLPNAERTPYQTAALSLDPFLPRAFRRPVENAEIERYAQLASNLVESGETYEQAMRVTLQAVLISPHFLFRVEGGRRAAGPIEMLDDYALASRLSYFLWNSMPDDELFELAKQGRLHQSDILRQQTERLLKSPRSEALVKNFAGQWLGLRKLVTTEVDPDTKLFPEFTKEVRMDLWKETETFFGSVVQNDASIYDLLDGRYTFLNERLAGFYGIPNVSGEEFRRVELTDQPRAGVLTQGSVLTLTSFPNRTSPVKRGEWVLSNIFNDPPPEAPPQVPALDETSKANPNMTFREQLELHRSDPGCASCHVEMDAIGFGFQTFDAIGRLRTKEGNHPVDASGMLPGGETFNGPLELIEVLRKQKTRFGRCLTEKMLTFSLGRGVEWYDRCTVDSIMTRLEKDDRFSSLIFGIVSSAPFQSRTYREPPKSDSLSAMATPAMTTVE